MCSAGADWRGRATATEERGAAFWDVVFDRWGRRGGGFLIEETHFVVIRARACLEYRVVWY